MRELSWFLTHTEDILYSPYVSLCVSPYRVPNLTLGRNSSILMNIKKWHLKRAEAPKHGNKHDLIHFVYVRMFPTSNASRPQLCFVIKRLIWYNQNLCAILLILSHETILSMTWHTFSCFESTCNPFAFENIKCFFYQILFYHTDSVNRFYVTKRFVCFLWMLADPM